MTGPANVGTTAASSLTGVKLDNGWNVVRVIPKSPAGTGGHFSVGYEVKNDDGREGFLKALDYSMAMSMPNTSLHLQAMTEAYNYEASILERCKTLSKVAKAIERGSAMLSAFGLLGKVDYIIFEKADGDVRSVMSAFADIEAAWKIRSLHHAATGIMQLHKASIAHQDIKPSNILVFGEDSKVSDLGRSRDLAGAIRSPVDNIPIAGDKSYVPLELLLDEPMTEEQKRLGCDAYMLGSLIFFYFTAASISSAIIANLSPAQKSNRQPYRQLLPHLQAAFAECLEDFRDCVRIERHEVADDMTSLVQELCEPDYNKRGNPRDGRNSLSQFSLDYYVSRLDFLAKKAEFFQ